MSYLLVLGSILLPSLMILLHKKWDVANFIFNVLALVSLLVFGNIASISIYQIIRDNTVFMTNIHAIFLNPFFLVTGAYLGVYLIYQILHLTIIWRNT